MEWDDDFNDFDDEEFENLADEISSLGLDTSPRYNKTCSLCGKIYEQYTEDQTPGFRMKDYDICPYCQGSNGESMSVEFFNSKIE